MRRIIILFIGLSSLKGMAQVDTLPARVTGIISAIDSSLSTPYVHVINKRTGGGVISDADGLFRTNVLHGDTLLFRCIGFSDFVYAVPDDSTNHMISLNIQLSQTSYEIDVVDIFALTRKKQIKYDLLNMKPDENAWENQMVMPGMMRSDYKWITDDERPLGVQAFNPIKAIAFAMGKDVRDLSALQRATEQGDKDAVVAKKYNRKVLEDFTKYHVNKLDCFTMYLELDEQFLLNESEYAIFTKVKQGMITFEFQYREDSLAMFQELLGKVVE